MVDRRLLPLFCEHGLRILHPAVMEHPCARIGEPFLGTALEILLRGFEMKSHRVSTGFDLSVVPDDADRFVIEPGIGRPIIGDEMQVAEQKTFDHRIARMLGHGPPERRQIVFVHHLVRLNVQGPLALAVTERNIGLL